MNYDVGSSPALVHGPGRTFTQPYGPQLSPLSREQRGLRPLGRHSSPGSWSVKKSNHHHPLHLPVKLTILGKLTTVQTDCSPSSYLSPYYVKLLQPPAYIRTSTPSPSTCSKGPSMASSCTPGYGKLQLLIQAHTESPSWACSTSSLLTDSSTLPGCQ